jgi:hypothetical protein
MCSPIDFIKNIQCYCAVTFDYCSLVWDNCSDYLLNKLQKLQNRAARVITGRTYETRSKDVLKELNWKPLSERLKRNKCIYMHKIKNNVMPQSVIEMFKIKENQVYQLRSNNINFSLGKPVTNFKWPPLMDVCVFYIF